MTINLFDEPTNAQGDTATTSTSTANPLEELVGEGKKFKTPEDLARGKLESDQFIERLKGELAGLRSELNTRQTLEQLMDKMAAGSGSTTDNSNQMANNQTPTNGDGTKSFTEDDVMRIVESKLSEAEKIRVQNNNLSLVRNALSERYGNDYVSKLKESAQHLGVDENFLQDMAKNQPKAFLKLIDSEAAGGNTNAASSNNSLFAPPTGQNLRSEFKPNAGRTKGYYDQLKAKSPSEYWSPAIQNQMHKDALSLGEKFFDTPN